MLSTLGSGAAWATGASRAAARLAATARRRGRRVDMGKDSGREGLRQWPYCTTAIAVLSDGARPSELRSPAMFHRRNEDSPPMASTPSVRRRLHRIAPLAGLVVALAAGAQLAPEATGTIRY